MALVTMGIAADPGFVAGQEGMAAAATMEVTATDDGRLSVHLGEVALMDVLAQVAVLSGAELMVHGEVGMVQPQVFSGQPVVEAIHRLIGRNSVALMFEPAEHGETVRRLSRIIVYGATQTTRIAPGRAPPSFADATILGPPVEMGFRSYAEYATLDSGARLLAIQRLGEAGEEADYNFLADIVGAEEDAALRRAAVAVLAQDDGWAAERALSVALTDPESEVRLEAVRALAEQSSATAATALSSVAADDADALVRRIAVLALARLDDKEARAALKRALRDPDPSVQDAAQRMLAGRARSALPAAEP